MPARQERTKLEVQSERAVLAAVRLPDSRYDVRDPFGELRALAEQAGAVVVGELTQNLPKPVAGTFMGTGKIVELKQLCETLEASTVIFDHDLSPKQIANIEKETGRKIIDRSELILDIFASRAQSAEAKLQVELAQLEYTFPRLRAMWDHLERIVGGGGLTGIGTRGPGEQQLEIDRRLVQNRRNDLHRRLEEIQGRKRREVFARRQQHFTVGLVGYTNAGKSTLFNTLTAGGAYADDRLFATLITRTREWNVQGHAGGAMHVMLSDTVGFVRDLPHNLVASFKATLEEATHADLLLIVLDVADPAAELQYETVNRTLDDLFKELRESQHEEDRQTREPKRVLLLNKVDRLKDNADVLAWQQRVPGALAVSALPEIPPNAPGRDWMSSNGHAELAALVREQVQGETSELRLEVPTREAKAIHAIEQSGHVLEREYAEDSVRLRVRIGRRVLDRLRAGGATIAIMGEPKPTRPAWKPPPAKPAAS
ncbi:MAG: GTPase HflX [Planctomycetota bacterium]|nr:GTPase HflX [Planctomycetota bacterium]